jgi:hypothetical protein
MRAAFVALAVVAALASPAATASDQFTTDKPSPLKIARRSNGEGPVVRFTGKVQLTGRFLVAWDLVNRTPRYLRVRFLPNEESAMLLPHAADGAPVKELLLSNNEAAAKLLLDHDAATKVLAKDVVALEGEAIVTIGDYRSVVDCDQRSYLARLLSAAGSRGVAVATIESKHGGC